MKYLSPDRCIKSKLEPHNDYFNDISFLKHKSLFRRSNTIFFFKNKLYMKYFITLLIFIIIFIIYLNLMRTLDIANFNNISKIDFEYVSYDDFQKLCDNKKPFVFNDYSNFNIDKILNNKYFNIKIFKSQFNNSNKFKYLNINKSISLFENYKNKYISYDNNNGIIKSDIQHLFGHQHFKPYYCTNINYDCILGSINSITPFTYHSNYSQFLYIIKGSANIKMTTFDYYQDLNKRDLWIENKNNIPTIDFSISDSINESNVLFVPPFTPYSIQLNEENTFIISCKYSSLMTSIVYLFNKSHSFLEKNMKQLSY